MASKQMGLQFLIGAVGALTLGAVLAAVDFREADAAKGKTQAQKVDKQAPAPAKTFPKKAATTDAAKAGGGSVKQ